MDLWKPPGFDVPSSWPLEGTHKILSLSLKSSSGYSVKGLKVLFRTQKWQHTVFLFDVLITVKPAVVLYISSFKFSLKVWLSIRIFFFKENLQRHFCCISVSLDPFWSKPLTIRSYCLIDYLCLFLPSRCWRCPLGSFWPLCRGTLRLCCTVSSVRTAKHSSLHLRTPP